MVHRDVPVQTRAFHWAMRNATRCKVAGYNLRLRLQSPFFRRYPPTTDGRFIDSRAMVSHEATYIYFRIPKAANSTVMLNLHYGKTGEWASGDLRHIKVAETKPISSFPSNIIENMLKKYFVFTFVRHPYSRLASAYLDKIAPRDLTQQNSADRRRRQNMIRALGADASSPISFSQFLDYVEFCGGIIADPHWASQSSLVGVPMTSVNYVGSVEDLPTGLNYVTGRLFGRVFEQRKVDHHATDAGQLADSLSTATRDRIYRLYEKDFDTFGYPRSDPTAPPRPHVL